jgi:hypothetical protein
MCAGSVNPPLVAVLPGSPRAAFAGAEALSPPVAADAASRPRRSLEQIIQQEERRRRRHALWWAVAAAVPLLVAAAVHAVAQRTPGRSLAAK